MCSVNSSNRVTASPSSSFSLRLFFWSFQSDIWKPLEGHREKRNILR
ncbi:nef attachable domain protein [Chlamydia psittaci 02DC14]|nr:nef attachable domain protein [Chlamydia psittaci 02DC14]